MQKKTKMLLGAGGGAALLAGIAGIALAQPRGLAAADVDKDGKVTVQEVEANARTRFAEADANKDGKLTGEEMPRRGRWHRGHHGGKGAPSDEAGKPATVPQAGQTDAASASKKADFKSGRLRMDADGDGAVTFQEFHAAARDRFVRADADQDGTLTSAEIDAARARRGGFGRRS